VHRVFCGCQCHGLHWRVLIVRMLVRYTCDKEHAIESPGLTGVGKPPDRGGTPDISLPIHHRLRTSSQCLVSAISLCHPDLSIHPIRPWTGRCPVSCGPFHNGNPDTSTGHSCPIRGLSLWCVPSIAQSNRWLTARSQLRFSPRSRNTSLTCEYLASCSSLASILGQVCAP